MKTPNRQQIGELSEMIQDGIYKAAALSVLNPDLFEMVERREITLNEAYAQAEPNKPKTRVQRIVTLFNLMSVTEQQTFLKLIAPSHDWQVAS